MATTTRATRRTGYTVRMYSYPEVARMLRVGVEVLVRWVYTGVVPPPYGHGSAALFFPDDVATMRAGLSLPGTYLVSRSPMSRDRVHAVRTEQARHNPAKTRPVGQRVARERGGVR